MKYNIQFFKEIPTWNKCSFEGKYHRISAVFSLSDSRSVVSLVERVDSTDHPTSLCFGSPRTQRMIKDNAENLAWKFLRGPMVIRYGVWGETMTANSKPRRQPQNEATHFG